MTEHADIFSRFYSAFRDRVYLSAEDESGLELSETERNIIRLLGQKGRLTSREICAALQLDAGYVSRIMKGFLGKDIIYKRASAEDGRAMDIVLSKKGGELYKTLELISYKKMERWIGGLSWGKREVMLRAMAVVENGLAQPEMMGRVEYRDPQPGDVSWSVVRQAVLMHAEYGWGKEFEAMLNQIAHDYLANFKPDRERCWIAEYGGEMVGSMFLVEKEPGVAQLRMLYVEPHARGLGIGKELLARSVAFAQEKGYRSVRLWTVNALQRAREMYEKAGFILLEEKPNTEFGEGLMGQMWAKGILT